MNDIIEFNNGYRIKLIPYETGEEEQGELVGHGIYFGEVDPELIQQDNQKR